MADPIDAFAALQAELEANARIIADLSRLCGIQRGALVAVLHAAEQPLPKRARETAWRQDVAVIPNSVIHEVRHAIEAGNG
jgi:hypothetical protein